MFVGEDCVDVKAHTPVLLDHICKEFRAILSEHLASKVIELDGETTGLIQTSYINKYNKKLNVGDEIKVKVILLIRDDRKIYLNFADAKDKVKTDEI